MSFALPPEAAALAVLTVSQRTTFPPFAEMR
jgi:hypothetical protein